MRAALHVLISLVLWGVFFYHWELVTRGAIGRGSVLAMQVMAVLISVGAVVTFWWVIHNLRIGRSDRRRGPPQVGAESLSHDTLGRPVAAPPLPRLKQARQIDVEVADGRKIYSVRAPVDARGDG